MNDNKYLWKKCGQHARELGLTQKEYKKRFMHEFKVIEEKGFSSYFLINSDIIEWAEENNIDIFVRGSANGSLVAYLAGITKIDPLKYGLLF